jgi:hypothetical protein
MGVKSYLLSVPERLLRSSVGLGAGAVREVGELALPDGVRESQLYRNLVDTTLRFLIEQVGEVEGVYKTESLPPQFIARRAAGNAVEVLGVVAFRASPVWVLAALADLCGAGRQLIPEIADALKAENLLDQDAEFSTVDQLLDGLERTSARLAGTINTPPLDVAGLRAEWAGLKEDARGLPGASLPSNTTLTSLWSDLKGSAVAHDRSIFETSSVMAVSAARSVPHNVRWLTSSVRVGARRTGQLVAMALLEHYRETLTEIERVGYLTYADQQFRPYLRAAAGQFRPSHPTLTERLLTRFEAARRRIRR